MAHRREEAPLGQDGLFGTLMGCLQGTLLLDPGGHILHHTVNPPPPFQLAAAATITLQPARALDRMFIAQRVGKRLAGMQHGQHGRPHLAPVLMNKTAECAVGMTADLLAGQAQQLVTATTDKFDPGYFPCSKRNWMTTPGTVLVRARKRRSA